MTNNDKELLMKDLCSRLPYGVKISVNDKIESLQGINVLDNIVEYGSFLSCDIEEVKPYLLPLSSMTGEQKSSHNFLKNSAYANPISLIKFYHKNHFDYNRLIEKGLAIDATGLNIY